MSGRKPLALTSLSVPLALVALSSSSAAQSHLQLPDGFIAERVGGAAWEGPIALAYIDEQRLLVADRGGQVWYVDHDLKRNLVYGIEAETQISGDRGLLGMAVARDFDRSGWIYLLYVVRIPGPDAAPTYSRLLRVRAELDASGDLVALPETRQILLGDTWPTGIPCCVHQHTLGHVHVLSDGSVVFSTGDAANGVTQGGREPGCFGPGRTPIDQDLGAFRSQYENSLSGKVLRVDPESGLGLADNPYFTGNPDDLRSRIYALGLRNPFRFTLLPDSGPREALLIADVGDSDWEEIDLCLGGENFGWPCFEGELPQPEGQAADLRGLCSGISAVPPLVTWHHSQSGSAGFTGQCATALCVYRGERYPAIYRGRLFFCDYQSNWMRAAELDGELRVQNVIGFGRGLEGPVDLVSQPGTGDLVYISDVGIRRLCYVGNQHPPVAVASATPSYGPGALDVTLSAEGSSDPDGLPLAYAWDLGDGTQGSGPELVHHYPVQMGQAGSGGYSASLSVTDAEGLVDSAEVRITPGNTPPRILELVTPRDGGTYVPEEPLRLAATAEDAEDGEDSLARRANWSLDLVHDHHVHPHWTTSDGLSTFVVPEGEPGQGDFHYVVRLSVSDASGLTDERSLEIYDARSQPQAHLVELATNSVRVGQTLAPVGHVDYAYGRVAPKQATLIWDWGDGTADVFPSAEHHVDTRPTHIYRRPGTYKLRLIAELSGASSIKIATIRVAQPRPAVAIFAPLDEERWIPRAEQDVIVAALESALARRASEVRAFHQGQGAELAGWMESLLSDPIADVVVLLDLLPSPLVEGGIPGSLLERWVAGGNGLLWTGATPFQGLLGDDGTESQTLLGADVFFGATAPYIVLGDGLQRLTPQGSSVVPSLMSYTSERALRTDQLGPAWRVRRVFAADHDQDSDALELEYSASGGFYAQFLCDDAAGLPRAAVLSEYLLDGLSKTKLGATGSAPARR